jgi:hypothetical protein
MRAIAVALLLAGLLGLAPAAHADVESAGYEAWLTRGCGSTLELVNGSPDEALFVVNRTGAEPLETVLAAGASWRVELGDLEPDPTVSVGQQVLTPTQVVAECGGVATIAAKSCDQAVVTMNAMPAQGPLDYQVWVAGMLAGTYPVDGETRVETVAVDPGEQVDVWDEWNLLDSLTVPPCQEPPPPVEPPPVEPPAAAPVPNPEVAVLGTKVAGPTVARPTATGPQLAMTGPREDISLVGVLLLVVGAALVRVSRPARHRSA